MAIAVLLAVFGLPPVDLHGPLHYRGVMDPLCGGTRSVYLTLHGHLRQALRYNPAGLRAIEDVIAALEKADLKLVERQHLSEVAIPHNLLVTRRRD